MKSDSQKVVYYSDPLNNDFAGTDIKQKKIKDNYVFIHKNPLWYVLEFVVYRIIATPLVTVFMKVAYGLKIKNRKVLRECKNQGYFLYGNHTSILSDAYAPTIISFIRKAFIIVNPDAISIPVIGHVIQMLGGIPLPTSYVPMKNYMQAISTHIKNKQCVMIYPEAHLWPYCTFIRPFTEASFGYAVRNEAPCFAVTTTYSKRAFLHTPKITIYLDGPFYADKNKSVSEQKKILRDVVYNTMCERAKNNSLEKIHYEVK